MNHSFPSPVEGRSGRVLLGTLALFLGSSRVGAQPVITADTPTSPEIVPAAVAPPPAVAPSLAVPPDPPAGTLFAWGQVTLHPHFAFESFRGDGINVQPGVPVATSIERYKAGFALVLGPHWVVGYAGVRAIYSNAAFRDTFDQAFTLAGANVYRDWTMQLQHVSESTDVPLVETARQTLVHQHRTVLTATYAAGSDYRLELSGTQLLRTSEGAPSSRERSGAAWLDYRLAPTVDLGAGVTAGFIDARPGTNLFYRTPQLRIAWRPQDTLQLRLTGGWEFCTFYSHAETQLERSVYSSSIEYRPARTTILKLHRDREVAIAPYSSQVSENTRDGIALQQRLLGHFFVTAGLERQELHYLDPSLSALVGGGPRKDSRRTASLRLSTTFRQRGTLSLVRERTRNASNLAGFDFTTNQTAFEIGYRF